MVDRGHYRALLAQLRARDRSKSQIGLYPPATEEQLRLTEERLGFSLPPALRLLYQEVGNGGDVFGNGCPLNGVVGGFPGAKTWSDARTIDLTVSRSGWRLNELVAAALRRYTGSYVQCEGEPDHFITVWDMYSISLDLDGWTGLLYLRGCGDDVHSYLVGQGLTPPPGSDHWYMQTISFYASSVEEWIERMLNGGLWPGSSRGQWGELTPEMVNDDVTPEVASIGE
jgi:hypothetical protein